MPSPFPPYVPKALTERELKRTELRAARKAEARRLNPPQTAEQIERRTKGKMAKESPLKARHRAERAAAHALLLDEQALAKEAAMLTRLGEG